MGDAAGNRVDLVPAVVELTNLLSYGGRFVPAYHRALSFVLSCSAFCCHLDVPLSLDFSMSEFILIVLFVFFTFLLVASL